MGEAMNDELYGWILSMYVCTSVLWTRERGGYQQRTIEVQLLVIEVIEEIKSSCPHSN